MEFRNKIEKLFLYRKLPELIDLNNIKEKERDVLLESLYALQESIYTLDAHLEGYWTLDEKEMEHCWNNIYQQLSDVGIPESMHDDFCQEIYMYEKHEIGQRTGLNVLDLDLLHFYSVKSCDVKLMRRIIYYKYPQLSQVLPIEIWESYDLITEFNDDIEDYYEDLETNNGNRFLMSVQKLGTEETMAIFSEGLKNSYNVFLEIKNTDFEHHPWIEKETQVVYRDTVALLEARIDRITAENLYIKS